MLMSHQRQLIELMVSMLNEWREKISLGQI